MLILMCPSITVTKKKSGLDQTAGKSAEDWSSHDKLQFLVRQRAGKKSRIVLVFSTNLLLSYKLQDQFLSFLVLSVLGTQSAGEKRVVQDQQEKRSLEKINITEAKESGLLLSPNNQMPRTDYPAATNILTINKFTSLNP